MKFKLTYGALGVLRDLNFGRDTYATPAEVRAWQAIAAVMRDDETNATVYLDEEARQALVARLNIYYRSIAGALKTLVGR